MNEKATHCVDNQFRMSMSMFYIYIYVYVYKMSFNMPKLINKIGITMVPAFNFPDSSFDIIYRNSNCETPVCLCCTQTNK